MAYPYLQYKHCRWCGTKYSASRPANKDGFHSDACKQAHYRAYKAYVTATDGPGQLQGGPSKKKK